MSAGGGQEESTNAPHESTGAPPQEPAEGTGARAAGSRVPALGRYGEGWVALQSVLFVIEVLCGLRGPRWPRPAASLRLTAAAVFAAAGLALFAAGSARLGRLLTPFPRPVAGGELRRGGVYGLVRHPLYGGVFLVSFAWALFSSPLALLPAAVTLPLFELKRRREEAWLREAHAEYDAYRREVPRRFIPFVW